MDESPDNAERLWTSIEAPAETLTVRELIRLRVESELRGYDAGLPRRIHGLLQLDGVASLLQGGRPDAQRLIDGAWTAFEKARFVVSVDGRPVDSLDEVIRINPGSAIRFLKTA